ncbi:flagellar hook-length control protein FliK [Brucepastera parasyntrophica]|uniref:flagellar hook-length control protein FliK n=1 Tax=Brucepastera parasyntrophica TaxID=2880008 RepID=UPI00210E6F96|nr:flagellar hook-length control protein FliK [Brucepastera parasyntrophica]ULQ59792.1 flagellar hook-length control protein FliK [Brucepastera parasyntrophica]
MQTLDVHLQNPVSASPPPGSNAENRTQATDERTGAETARNGNSFLAMIEKMIAGTREGKTERTVSVLNAAERGAGDADVTGDENILTKQGLGRKKQTADMKKKHFSEDTALPNGVEAALLTLNMPEKDVSVRKNTASAESDGEILKVSGAEENLLENTEHIGSLPEKNNSEADIRAAVFAGTAKTALTRSADEKSGNSPDKKLSVSGDDEVKKKDAGFQESVKNAPKAKKTLISVQDRRDFDMQALHSESQPAKTVDIHQDGTADMTIGFRNADGRSSFSDAGLSAAGRSDGEGNQTFSSMLSQELKANAADFVKAGSIILRNNDTGLIRLTLHPESLGNVKISLELSGDKKISGKIIVSSKEAYDAFNENLDGLSEAFVKGGFESAGFDLSWSGGEGANYGRQHDGGRISSPFYASSIPSVMLASENADTVDNGHGYSKYTAMVDVFA